MAIVSVLVVIVLISGLVLIALMLREGTDGE